MGNIFFLLQEINAMFLTDLIPLRTLGDDRGGLTVLEGGNDLPFEIKRVYYLTRTKPKVSRGFHAHIALRQMAVCISGECEMVMDDGYVRETVLMNSSERGILIEPMVWHEMHNFSEDCVLLVLASDIYDEADYIRIYDDFLEIVRAKS